MPELKPTFSLPDARDLILEAALGAFAERGLHGANMRDIAARAGVSQSLLHHHFGSKEALWNLVGERTSADFLDYMAAALSPELSAADGARQMMQSYMDYWKDHPAAFRFHLWRVLEGPRNEREKRSSTLNTHVVGAFKRAQDAGCVRKDIPAGLAMFLGGSFIQFWLHSQIEIRDALAITGDAPPSDDAVIDLIMDLIRAPGSQPTEYATGEAQR